MTRTIPGALAHHAHLTLNPVMITSSGRTGPVPQAHAAVLPWGDTAAGAAVLQLLQGQHPDLILVADCV